MLCLEMKSHRGQFVLNVAPPPHGQAVRWSDLMVPFGWRWARPMWVPFVESETFCCANKIMIPRKTIRLEGFKTGHNYLPNPAPRCPTHPDTPHLLCPLVGTSRSILKGTLTSWRDSHLLSGQSEPLTSRLAETAILRIQ